MKQRSVVLFCLTFALAAGLGCGKNEPAKPQKSAAIAAEATEQVARVEPIDQAELKKLINERNGKILFLNIWATWCAPCVEEYPDLVKLAHLYSNSDVEVVGISADYPDEIESKIQPFLKKQNVPFRSFVAKFDHQEDFINSVNPKWSGALPATLIIDQTGKQRFFRVGAGTFDLFRSSIDSVRAQPRGAS